MSKYTKSRKSVESDPEWFMEGGPVPFSRAGKKRVPRARISLEGKSSRAEADGDVRSDYVRKVLREMGYHVV
jgi:hypothetical protein